MLRRCTTCSLKFAVSRTPSLSLRRYSVPGNHTSPWLQNRPQGTADEVYTTQTQQAVGFLKRYAKWCFIGFSGIGLTLLSAAAATHLWIERVEFAPETDQDSLKWEWDLEAERWGQAESGGTDPALGFMGRFGVRSAWLEHYWTSPGTLKEGQPVPNRVTSFDAAPLERRLETTRNFLDDVLDIALTKESSGQLSSQTVTDILVRRADILERMGTKAGLSEARYELQRVWTRLAGKGPLATRAALKLGDLNFRLGDADSALAWWSRCIQLISPVNDPSQTALITPSSPPSSPSAQRILASTLVSLSAFYATSGQLNQAQTVQESALDLLRSIQTPEPSSTPPPLPQTLHALYILHRSSLISVHHAEVLYALKNPPAQSMKWLSQAAQSSERVAFALTGLPMIHPKAPDSKIPHPPSSEEPLLPGYSKSLSMKRPAKSLLRDARRSAAEAWNLLGVLHEGKGDAKSLQASLNCYERALGWAGVGTDGTHGGGRSGDGILEVEWKVLLGNYVRVRDALRASAAAPNQK
ncbi:hypothetical protein BC834DRAFT_816653 [Gloeopeniophorella convolvens]|nr:hypothetical protein BC834DRAFT_816653 [Gloeopeniophorella convolvens]